MKISERYRNYIDETARKPSGKRGIGLYNDPKSHYQGFDIIVRDLAFRDRDQYVEIGCGGGILLNMALKKVESAAALDHSSDMVALSKKNNAEAVTAGRVEILQGDATALPWQDNSFTTAANANMFFFITQPEKVLSEIHRVLKPGGRFSMVTMSNNLLGKIAFGLLYRMRTYSNRRMKVLLKDAGFTNIEIRSTFPFSQICYAVKPEKP